MFFKPSKTSMNTKSSFQQTWHIYIKLDFLLKIFPSSSVPLFAIGLHTTIIRCEKYIKSFMPWLTGAFLSMGLIMNFLSLNEMFLISLQGNPIFGVNLSNEEEPKLISCNWQFFNFLFVFVNKHHKNHRLCGPLVLRCDDLSIVSMCWLVWLVVGLESYSAGH